MTSSLKLREIGLCRRENLGVAGSFYHSHPSLVTETELPGYLLLTSGAVAVGVGEDAYVGAILIVVQCLSSCKPLGHGCGKHCPCDLPVSILPVGLQDFISTCRISQGLLTLRAPKPFTI